MNSRLLVSKMLFKVFNEGAYSNIIFNEYVKKYSPKSEDIGLITEIFYGTIRYKYTIDKILSKFIKNGIESVNHDILNILRLSIYQLKYLTKVPEYAILNEGVELSKSISKSSSKFVNAILRNYLRNKANLNLKFKNNIEELSFMYSFEPWMVKHFLNQYGEENIVSILKGLNETPEITLRCNLSKITRDECMNKLKDLNYEVKPSEISDNAIYLKKGGSIEKNSLFSNGYVSVQDESAMLSVEELNIKNGMTIMDLCSAPGGKSAYIGELLGGTGKVLAFDVSEKKLELVKKYAKRIGLENIYIKCKDAREYDKEYLNCADGIILDVPCSGLGIIKKKPEIKWNKSLKDLTDIVKTQKEILNSSNVYLKSGGILIYSTCTLNKFENERIIEDFLKENNNFVLETVDFIHKIKDNYNNTNKYLNYNNMMTIMPKKERDGFFIAKLRKIKK